jgi:Leucine-rich repeat (LRR) protein
LDKDCGLVSLNLANNDLVGQPAIESLLDWVRNSRVLRELNLSQNKIGDAGVLEIAKVFQENSSCLMKLDLSNCGLTS